MFKTLTRIISIIFLFCLGGFINNSYGYTTEDGNIEMVKDPESLSTLKSTLSYPSGFIDGTIYTNLATNEDGTVNLKNIPLGVGRSYWTEGIDDSGVDCSNSSDGNNDLRNLNFLKNRKCFMRYSGMFTKIDLSGNSTWFPNANNLLRVRINENLKNDADFDQDGNAREQGAFEFGIAGFGATWGNHGMAQWGEVNRSTDKLGPNDQGTALQVYLIGEDGEEVSNEGVDIYAEMPDGSLENVTENLGYRKVITSMNPKLFRGKCLTPPKQGDAGMAEAGKETNEDSYNTTNPNCVSFNMIFGLTPKLVVKKSDWSVSSGGEIGGIKYKEIGVRMMPVIRGYNGKLYEPSFKSNDSLGKASMVYSRFGNAPYGAGGRWNQDGSDYAYHLKDDSGNIVGEAGQMSNYLAFITTSSLQHQYSGIYKKGMNFNQFFSVLKANGDLNSDKFSKDTSEWLNYNGGFITHQVKGRQVGSFKPLLKYSETNKAYVMPTTLGCEVGQDCPLGQTTTKEFHTQNNILNGVLKKGSKFLYIITLDADNIHSDPKAGPQSSTSMGIASMTDDKQKGIELAKREFIGSVGAGALKESSDNFKKAFDTWMNGGVTSAYGFNEKAKAFDTSLSGMDYIKPNALHRNGTIPFVTQGNLQSVNEKFSNLNGTEGSINENRSVVKPSFAMSIFSGEGEGKDNMVIEFVDKNYNPSQGSIDPEGSYEENSQKPKEKVTVSGFRHGQGKVDTLDGGVTYNRSGVGIFKVPVQNILVRDDEQQYLNCTGEGENQECELTKDYHFNYFISFSDGANALGYTMSSDFMTGPCQGEDCDKDNTPIDLNIKLDNLCVFRKNAAEVDPKNAFYKLLNADNQCKDINVEHGFSATQEKGTDDHNYDVTNVKTKEAGLVENPIEPLSAGQKAKMEINDSNICDLAFVGKVTASNLNLLHKEIKNLEVKLSNAPQNVELLNVADIDVGNRAVKFQSKKLSEPLDPSNPILNTFGLLQGEDMEASKKIFNENPGILTRKEAYGKIKIEACDGQVFEIDGDSNEKLLYLEQQIKSKNGGVCQYSFEYAFRPISQACSPMDPQEYGKAITKNKEVSIGLADKENPITVTKAEVTEGETSETNPEKFARVLDYEPSRADITKNPKYAGILPFKKMDILNFGFKVDSLDLCGQKQEGENGNGGNTDAQNNENCKGVKPVGKKVVFAGLGMNTEPTPSMRIRLYPNGECVDYKSNGGVTGGNNLPGASTDANKKSADKGGSCGKTMVDCESGMCKVPVKVCLRNEDKQKRDLFRARVMGMMGNFSIIPGELNNLDILHNQMNLGPNKFGTLKFGEEEKCSEVIVMEKESKICGEKVVRIKMKGEADYNQAGDQGGISVSKDETAEWTWDIECKTPPPTCIEAFGVEFCDPNGGTETPPTTPENPPHDPTNPPSDDTPWDPGTGTEVPPTTPNTNLDSQCIHRGWTAEITRFFKNKNDFPVKNARVVYEIDSNSYVFSSNDFVRRNDGKYEKTFLNVFNESSTPISSIVIGVKDGVPSGTKIIVKETATFELMDGSTQTIVNDREFMYGQGRPGEKCEPDSLQDFITLELPRTPIGEEPWDPDTGTEVPPTVPYENPGIPFNEIPSNEIPSDGGRIKNCGMHDGKAPGVNGKGGTYCSQDPGLNNSGTSMREIEDVCAIYNPTAKTGLNGTGQDAQKTDGESGLPDELPVARVIKANYYRVEADEFALKNPGFKLDWSPGISKFNLHQPKWGSILQTDSEDYTNGERDLVENSTRMIYKDPYIDWTIELPCQVKLASEYFGSNDTGDNRGSFEIIERNENRSYTTSEGNVCKQKVYKVRQYIKTKGSDYSQPYYETDQLNKFEDEVQRRLEGVTNPLETEFKNRNVFRYITFAVTPDNEQGRQKIDVSKNSFDLNNYIKVTGQLGYKRLTRAVIDEATTQPGKYKGSGSCYKTTPGKMTQGYRVCGRTSCWCEYSDYPLDYHRDKLVKEEDIVTTAQGMNSSRIGGSSGYNSTYNKNFNDEHVSLKTEGNKALLLHDICNPGAALCVLGGDAYSRKGISLEKAVFDYRLPGEFSFISGGGIKLSKSKTGESKESEDKTIYEGNVNFSFEDPTGTREEKIRNPKVFCDYVDSTGKVNPETDSNGRCKTTYFEDLKTGRKGGVKKITQQKWTTDLNLSDTDNPTNPTTPQDYKATSGQDIVWHVEGNLVIGDHPNKWLNVRGKGTVFVEGDLYINSNMQYVTNTVTDIKDAYKIDSAAFVVSGNIYIAPEVTSTVGVMAAMGPNSAFYSCGDTSKDRERGIDNGTSCTSRSPLLIQQLIARQIHFDRLPSNVPLYVKKVILGNKLTGNNVAPVCSTIGDSDEDKKNHPECFVDKCIEAKNHLEDKNGCFEVVNQMTSSECVLADPRTIINPPTAISDNSGSKMKRIEIAPGENTDGNIIDRF